MINEGVFDNFDANMKSILSFDYRSLFMSVSLSEKLYMDDPYRGKFTALAKHKSKILDLNAERAVIFKRYLKNLG